MLFLRVPWLHAVLNRLFAFFGRPARESRGRMIEYHVPEDFQTPLKPWLASEGRGKLIEFSAPGPADRRDRVGST